MIELSKRHLVFRFPEVHQDAVCRIEFQRTLRIPDDDNDYYLPPGLGRFPLKHVDDYTNRVPQNWAEHGGVFLPMYQAEAMWLNFSGDYPMAVKVAAGKIDAVTGHGWKNELSEQPQDYLVIPDQPWLDGFCVERGLIRQFVAMPLGEGYTAEEQLTGEAQHGGLQIVVYPMKASVYKRQQSKQASECLFSPTPIGAVADTGLAMGLAPGGRMRQEIYEDDYGFDAWDTSVRSRCFVHILNSLQYFEVTEKRPPHRPPTAAEYTEADLPWFDYYAADQKALQGAKELAGLDSVATKLKKMGKGLTGNEPVVTKVVKKLRGVRVREGQF